MPRLSHSSLFHYHYHFIIIKLLIMYISRLWCKSLWHWSRCLNRWLLPHFCTHIYILCERIYYKFCVYPKLISAKWTARLVRGYNMNWEHSIRAWTGTWNSETLLAPPASRVMIRCMHVIGMLAPSLGRAADLISAKLGSNSASNCSVCCNLLKYHAVHFLCC